MEFTKCTVVDFVESEFTGAEQGDSAHASYNRLRHACAE